MMQFRRHRERGFQQCSMHAGSGSPCSGYGAQAHQLGATRPPARTFPLSPTMDDWQTTTCRVIQAKPQCEHRMAPCAPHACLGIWHTSCSSPFIHAHFTIMLSYLTSMRWLGFRQRSCCCMRRFMHAVTTTVSLSTTTLPFLC